MVQLLTVASCSRTGNNAIIPIVVVGIVVVVISAVVVVGSTVMQYNRIFV